MCDSRLEAKSDNVNRYLDLADSPVQPLVDVPEELEGEAVHRRPPVRRVPDEEGAA